MAFQTEAAVLVDFPVDMDSAVSRQLATERVRALQVDRESWTREFVAAIHQNPPSEEYLEALTRAALSVPTNAAAIMIANVDLVGPLDLGPAVEALDRPALFVYCSLDWAVAAAQQVRRRLV